MQKRYSTALMCLLLAAIFAVAVPHVRADLIDDLKSKIDERNKVIADLEKEIAEYQLEVEKTGAQAKTLKNNIATLELTRKKISAEINVIQNKVTAANLNIQQLNSQIADTEATMRRTVSGLATIIQQTDMEESASFAEVLLNYPTISAFLDKVESFSRVNKNLKAALENLRVIKKDLELKNAAVRGTKRDLQNLASNLTDKKKVAEYNKTQTNKLLTATKNKQSEYQKILDQKVALRNAFAQELLEYESQLKFAIDPSSLPDTATGVLKWPLDNVKVTQYFGNTDFAKTHAQVYGGQGHNGIDFKAAIGTPIKAALQGTVVAAGDTDKVCPNASYGRWVLLEHPNGLSTLYAHLSVIKVAKGQSVDTSQVLGYSGETGYATGPHLHFTVYASQGVRVITRKSAVCQGSYTIPVASLNAYLNPLSYL